MTPMSCSHSSVTPLGNSQYSRAIGHMMNSAWFCQKVKLPTVSYGFRWPCAIRYQACWYCAKSGVSAKRL